jgi:hypothetical protein
VAPTITKYPFNSAGESRGLVGCRETGTGGAEAHPAGSCRPGAEGQDSASEIQHHLPQAFCRGPTGGKQLGTPFPPINLTIGSWEAMQRLSQEQKLSIHHHEAGE